MIFNGNKELADIAQYRERAVERMLARGGTGIGQIDLEALECLERLYVIIPELPEADVIRYDSKEKPLSGRTRGGHFSIVNDGIGRICLDDNEIARTDIYVDELFGEKWSKSKIEYVRKTRGFNYNYIENSIYDYSFFSVFGESKSAISKYISKLTIWFVALHEFAHIACGHLELLDVYANEEITLERKMMEAMEAQADIFAAEYLTLILLDTEKYVGVKQIYPNFNKKNPEPTFCDDVSFAAMAAYLALRGTLKDNYWDEYTVGLHKSNPSKHPATELRISIVYNQILNCVQRYCEKNNKQDALLRSVYIMISQFEDYCFKIYADRDGLTKINYCTTDFIRSVEGKAYWQETFENIIELNEKLRTKTTTRIGVDGKWTDYETVSAYFSSEDI